MHDMVIVFDLQVSTLSGVVRWHLCDVGFSPYSLQGLIAFVSPACAALLGFRPDELFDRPLSSVLAPECHEEFEVRGADAGAVVVVCHTL